MSGFLAICCLTTLIALASALWAGHSTLQRSILPWTAGVLLGVGIFWILPEMAQDQGWIVTVAGLLGSLLLLVWIDRRVCPICPFCAAGLHLKKAGHTADSCQKAATLGWPLLTLACIHTFFDGWTIGLSAAARHSSSALALSWGATVHKLPESVAIGVLAARLTSGRKSACGAVLLIQAVMVAGGILSAWAGSMDDQWAEVTAIPACAFLLLFGLLTLHQEWQVNGRLAAIGAAAPGLVGSGLAALATMILVR